MNKRETIIESMKEEAKKLDLKISDDLINKVTVGLGPSIYNKDSSSVACSQSAELKTVRENFLKKKLGLTDDDATLDKAIKEVCEEMKSVKNKKRVLMYALLTMKFKKESVYA